MLTEKQREEFKNTILNYYHENPRSFPWRETYDPYSILVSEIMLQQTQTERVVPKYKEWIASYPDAASLASSSLSDVLVLWNGLGYNRRARFLRDACRIISSEMGGVFPREPDILDELPGIGPYTARAVCTFAFGNKEVFIETNIRSVYIFFFFSGVQEVHDRDILSLVEETLYRENPRDWYYALMDYGAALKKTVKNPGRKSSHYALQSRFEGSVRQARGAVLRILTKVSKNELPGQPLLFFSEEQKNNCGVSLLYIAEEEKIGIDRITQAAQSLCAEGLVCRDGDVYYISL